MAPFDSKAFVGKYGGATKSGFDPSAFVGKYSGYKPGATETFLTHAVKGASQGLLPKMGGGMSALNETIFGDQKWSDFPETYEREKDTLNEALRAQAAINPTAAATGEIGGMVASSFVPGLNTAKIASTGGKLLHAGGLGATYGFGTSEADDWSGTLEDTLYGAAGGVVGEGAGQLAGKGVRALRRRRGGDLPAIPGQKAPNDQMFPKTTQKLADFSKERAVKQAGARKSHFLNLGRKQTEAELGQTLIETGIVKPGSSVDDVLIKSREVVEEYGQKLGDIVGGIDDQFVGMYNDAAFRNALPDASKIAARIKSEILDVYGADVTYKGVLGPIVAQFEQYTKMAASGKMRLSKLWKLKQNLDQFVKHNKAEGPANKLLQKVRGILNDEMDRAVDEISTVAKSRINPQTRTGAHDAVGRALEEWKKNNKIYGAAKFAQETSLDRIAAEKGARFFSPSDSFMAMGGFAYGAQEGDVGEGLQKAALVGFGNRALRKYGPAIASRMSDRMSKVVGSVPSASKVAEFGLEAANRTNLPSRVGTYAAVNRERSANNEEDVMQAVSGTKYQQVLQEAKQRGGNAYSAAYFMLQKDPEFRKVMSGIIDSE